MGEPVPPRFDPSLVRAVIFDLDGTLIDSYAAIAASLNQARSFVGLPVLDDDAVRRRVGRGLESLVAELVGPDRVAESVGRFRRHYAEIFLDTTVALPDAVDVVAELRKRGFRLAVASNKPSRFSRQLLDRLGMGPAFETVLGPDEAGATKPDPAMLRLALEQLDTPPRQAVYVGDMTLDVESAGRAGLPVVLVPGGSSSLHELTGTGEQVLPSLAHLIDLLPASPGR